MDKKSKIPLYLQLKESLIDKIEKETYRENEMLPPERKLCEIYDLSRTTVRQALQELEREGHIYKLHGKGTFVSPKLYQQSLVSMYSFTEEMKKIGKLPSTKVLSFTEISIDQMLANIMNLRVLEEVFRVERLRLADESPLMYEISYLPKKVFPNLTATDLVERPMYSVFQEDYEIYITKAIERFSATLIGEIEAKYLEVKENQSAMFIKRLAYHHDLLIEYTISVVRGDKFEYSVELT